MRVIAGTAKGHRLKAPKGQSTRPTSDLVRGAIFSMLESLPVDWTDVLDLYAGTGALGIEALSRGASHADFVEANSSVCSIIRENLQITKLTEQAHVYCTTVEKSLLFLEGTYGVIFMDPPYGDQNVTKVLEGIAESRLVETGSAVVCEHSRRSSLPSRIGKLELIKDRRHGDTCISIYFAQED